MITAYMTSQVIYVAARLGIAELLQDGARSGDELARATGTHAPSLRRLLHSCRRLPQHSGGHANRCDEGA